jgi:uncharacterized protein (TIGR02246 family)
MLARPDDFIRAFVAAWSARDADGLAALCAPDAEALTLTGLWCNGRHEIAAALRQELAGAFAQSRLVSGRLQLRPLGPGAAILSQRFVVTGLVDAAGQDVGRLGTVLTAVLIARAEGWFAAQMTFSVVEG